MVQANSTLLRSIFIEAVGDASSAVALEGSTAPKMDNTGVDEASGASQLSSEQIEFLNFAEDPSVDLSALAARVATMSPDGLMACASLHAEILNHCNHAEAHERMTTWKAVLRADSSYTHEGSSNPTFQACYDKIVAKGVTPAAVREALANQKVDLVLTAHPTQAQRRTILLKQRRIVDLLEEYNLLAGKGTPGEMQRLRELIKRELRSAWRTSSVRRSKPTAEGEARNGMAVVEETLWRALPEHYRRIDRLLQDNGMETLPYNVAPVQISSWMGGDRDGNPNVTSAITRRVVTLLRSRAAELYYHEVDTLLFELTHNGPITEEMREAVQACVTAAGDRGTSTKVFGQHSDYGVAKVFQTGVPEDEPYRIMLMGIRRRLFKTRQVMDKLYMGEIKPSDAVDPDVLWSKDEILKPLEIMYRSLVQVGDRILADGTLLDLIRRVNTFGIALTRLDCRQESDRHAEALAEITEYLGLGSFLSWDEEKRCTWIETELASKRPLIPADMPASDRVREVLDTFAVLAELPPEALGAYVISMAHSASDVLAVRLLQKVAGVVTPMRVAPLFETREDLQAAPGVMRRVFAAKNYDHGGAHEVMLGYSDSSKDAGKLASLWELHCAQEAILAVGNEAGVAINFFHGRGGSIGRGGGPQHLALLSQPAGSINGAYRVTVQGEQISAFFGAHSVAVHTFQNFAVSVLEHTVAPPRLPTSSERAIMQNLADESAQHFQQMIYKSAGGAFAKYFHAASPNSALASMNLGSRPAKRKAQGGIETLRAIPWVFAWTQMRLHLPAWLGGGMALKAMAETSDGLAQLKEMYANWPFFSGLLDLVELEISKAEPKVSEFYEAKCCTADPNFGQLGTELRAGLSEAVETLLKINGKACLLQDQPRTKEEFAERVPYLNALHAIQGEVMGRLRTGDAPAEGSSDHRHLTDAMVISVQGIAAGLQNTG